MFLAMSKDIRVLIIKLADRLHNMRTLEFMRAEKKLEKARETLDIYAPLASRLGIYTVKFELEDISEVSTSKRIRNTGNRSIGKKEQRVQFINQVIDEIKEALDQMNMQYDISGRSKHLYSVYKKMVLQHKQLDEIFDLTAVRIIVENVRTVTLCWDRCTPCGNPFLADSKIISLCRNQICINPCIPPY